MPGKARYHVLKTIPDNEADANEMIQDLAGRFRDAGVDMTGYENLNRLVVILPDSLPHARASEVFEEAEHEISDLWVSGEPSGRLLSINLFYHDEDQVVSASIDEGLLLSALAFGGKDDERLKHAVTALAGDNEFTFGYGPLNGDMSVQDIMIDVIFWDPDEALRWSPLSWDPEEPMVEITFTPQAETESGDIVPVVVDSMKPEWLMPVRLLPEGVDPENAMSMDKLAGLPCAPETVRKWVEMMPYEVSIENPEALADSAPDESPGL